MDDSSATSPREKYKEQPREMGKFEEIELQKIFDAMLSILTLRVQIGIFFGTINLGALGLAFTNQKAGLIFLASIPLWSYVIFELTASYTVMRYYARGLELQKQFAPDTQTTYLSASLPYGLKKTVSGILQITAEDKRHKALWDATYKSPIISGFGFPLLASLLEVALGFVFWLGFGWQLF